MQPVFVAELQLIGARSCHGAAPVRILVSTKETGGMMVIICFERDKSLFFAVGARSDALAGGGRGRFKNSSRG